jgi:integrase
VNVYHHSHYGEALGYHGVVGVCQHYLGTSKVHTTRHTFVVLMERAGAKLTDIQQRLGHKNAATTGIYLQQLRRERNPYGEKLAALLGFEDEEEPKEATR